MDSSSKGASYNEKRAMASVAFEQARSAKQMAEIDAENSRRQNVHDELVQTYRHHRDAYRRWDRECQQRHAEDLMRYRQRRDAEKVRKQEEIEHREEMRTQRVAAESRDTNTNIGDFEFTLRRLGRDGTQQQQTAIPERSKNIRRGDVAKTNEESIAEIRARKEEDIRARKERLQRQYRMETEQNKLKDRVQAEKMRESVLERAVMLARSDREEALAARNHAIQKATVKVINAEYEEGCRTRIAAEAKIADEKFAVQAAQMRIVDNESHREKREVVELQELNVKGKKHEARVEHCTLVAQQIVDLAMGVIARKTETLSDGTDIYRPNTVMNVSEWRDMVEDKLSAKAIKARHDRNIAALSPASKKKYSFSRTASITGSPLASTSPTLTFDEMRKSLTETALPAVLESTNAAIDQSETLPGLARPDEKPLTGEALEETRGRVRFEEVEYFLSAAASCDAKQLASLYNKHVATFMASQSREEEAAPHDESADYPEDDVVELPTPPVSAVFVSGGDMSGLMALTSSPVVISPESLRREQAAAAELRRQQGTDAREAVKKSKSPPPPKRKGSQPPSRTPTGVDESEKPLAVLVAEKIVAHQKKMSLTLLRDEQPSWFTSAAPVAPPSPTRENQHRPSSVGSAKSGSRRSSADQSPTKARGNTHRAPTPVEKPADTLPHVNERVPILLAGFNLDAAFLCDVATEVVRCEKVRDAENSLFAKDVLLPAEKKQEDEDEEPRRKVAVGTSAVSQIQGATLFMRAVTALKAFENQEAGGSELYHPVLKPAPSGTSAKKAPWHKKTTHEAMLEKLAKEREERGGRVANLQNALKIMGAKEPKVAAIEVETEDFENDCSQCAQFISRKIITALADGDVEPSSVNSSVLSVASDANFGEGTRQFFIQKLIVQFQSMRENEMRTCVALRESCEAVVRYLEEQYVSIGDLNHTQAERWVFCDKQREKDVASLGEVIDQYTERVTHCIAARIVSVCQILCEIFQQLVLDHGLQLEGDKIFNIASSVSLPSLEDVDNLVREPLATGLPSLIPVYKDIFATAADKMRDAVTNAHEGNSAGISAVVGQFDEMCDVMTDFLAVHQGHLDSMRHMLSESANAWSLALFHLFNDMNNHPVDIHKPHTVDQLFSILDNKDPRATVHKMEDGTVPLTAFQQKHIQHHAALAVRLSDGDYSALSKDQFAHVLLGAQVAALHLFMDTDDDEASTVGDISASSALFLPSWWTRHALEEYKSSTQPEKVVPLLRVDAIHASYERFATNSESLEFKVWLTSLACGCVELCDISLSEKVSRIRMPAIHECKQLARKFEGIDARISSRTDFVELPWWALTSFGQIPDAVILENLWTALTTMSPQQGGVAFLDLIPIIANGETSAKATAKILAATEELLDSETISTDVFRLLFPTINEEVIEVLLQTLPHAGITAPALNASHWGKAILRNINHGMQSIHFNV